MANMMVLVSMLVAVQISASQAANCAGYKIDIVKLGVCKELADQGITSVVRPGTIKLNLTADCKLYSSGCVDFDSFNTASVSYWGAPKKSLVPMAKVNMTKSGIDGCAQMDDIDSNVKTVMSAMNVPTACPVTAGQICSNESRFVDISNNTKHIESALLIGGCFIGRIDTEFDTGRACIEFEIKVGRVAAAKAKSAKSGFRMPKLGKK